MSRIFTGGAPDKITYVGPPVYPYTNQVTFAAWVLRTSNPDPSLYRFLLEQSSDSQTRWIWGSNNNGSQGPYPGMRFYIYGSGGGYQKSWNIAYPALNTWTHMAFTFDAGNTGNNPIFYYNGVPQSYSTYDGWGTAINTSGRQIILGSNNSGTSGWPGQLQNVAEWNDILSPAEIMALARGVSLYRIRTGKLIWHFPMFQTSEEGDWASGKPGTRVGTTVTPAPVPSGPLLVV